MSKKFWSFEKEFLIDFFQKRPEIDIASELDEKDIVTIERDLKYGNLEYLNDSLQFLPSKESAISATMNIYLGNDNPKKILSELLEEMELPFVIAVDFWSIAENSAGKKMVVYPSYGTSYNEIRVIKTDRHLRDFLKSLDSSKVDLLQNIYDAHVRTRQAIRETGWRTNKALTMWIQLRKSPIYRNNV